MNAKHLKLALLLVLAACADSTNPHSKITIQLPRILYTGHTFMVRAVDAAGRTIPANQVDWKSAVNARATISERGELRVYAPGSVSFSAASDLGDGTITATTVLDTLPDFRQIETVDLPDTVNVGDVIKAGITVTDTTGNPVQIPDKFLTWGSTRPDIATVDDSGVVTVVAGGSWTCITVILNDRARCHQLNVRAASGLPSADTGTEEVDVTSDIPTDAVVVGNEVHLTAVLLTALKSLVPDRPVVWGSHNEGGVSVDATGTAKAHTQGGTTVTAVINNVARPIWFNVQDSKVP